MQRPFNRGEFDLGLGQLLGHKGALGLTVENDISPVLQILDLSDSPYLSFPRGVMVEDAAGAVAAQNSGVLCRPGAGVVLQVQRIYISNPTAGALTYAVTILTNTQAVALTLLTGQQFRFVNARQHPELASSFTNVESNASALPGSIVDLLEVPPRTTLAYDIAAPGLSLYGNDPGGPPFLGVICQTVNTACRASFSAREWPLPG